MNSVSLKCIELKGTNEIIREYTDKVDSLIDIIPNLEKFLRNNLGSNYKKVEKLLGQYKLKEIGKEELIIKGSQLAGKEFITAFIKNIPTIIHESRRIQK